MFTNPRVGDRREDQFETAQTYLGRERRMLALRGPIIAAPGRWDQFSVTFIMDDIVAMNLADPEKPIYLIIDSPGGELDAGMMLYDLIKMSRAPIVTIGQDCASMATVILAAGHTRLSFPHARLMLHLPSMVFQGDSKLFEIRQKEMERLKNEMVDAYVECGVTARLDAEGKDPDGVTWPSVSQKIQNDIDRELWLDAGRGIEYGLVDRVATTEDLFGGIQTQAKDGTIPTGDFIPDVYPVSHRPLA